jgi:hypothetical protein
MDVPLRPSLIHFRLPLHGFPHSDHSTGLIIILPPPRKVRGSPAGPTSALASVNEQQQAQAILAESPKSLALLAYHASTIDKNSKLIGWVIAPCDQGFLVELRRAVGIDAEALHAAMTDKERSSLV